MVAMYLKIGLKIMVIGSFVPTGAILVRCTLRRLDFDSIQTHKFLCTSVARP